MTSLSSRSFAVSFVAALTLLGAGCSRTPAIPDAGTLTPTSTVTSSSTGSVSDPSTIAASSTLDTTGWQTYQNKTLKFSFQSPIKGAFAPEYTVKLLPLTSKDFPNDCAKGGDLPNATEQHLTVNGTAFCRTTTLEGAAGSTYNQDTWVTKTDKWYAVITFTKKYVTDPRIIAGCEEGGKDAAQPRCQPFDAAGYRRQIDSIMSTFKFPSAT